MIGIPKPLRATRPNLLKRKEIKKKTKNGNRKSQKRESASTVFNSVHSVEIIKSKDGTPIAVMILPTAAKLAENVTKILNRSHAPNYSKNTLVPVSFKNGNRDKSVKDNTSTL